MRWRDSMPQYHVGHVARVEKIEDRVATHNGLELAGNAYRGVGIPQSIHSGRSAAERLAKQLVK
jgi:oxygen-dependent protoporphyrinogen oxidase